MTQVYEVNRDDEFALYKLPLEKGGGYAAGYPSYPANFSRDTLLSGLLTGHSDLLNSQLKKSADYQGSAENPLTGEQPGRIHHEMPGAMLAGREGYTTYNACDTTALFLIGAEALSLIDYDLYANFHSGHRGNLVRAVDYILSHTGDDDLMWEDPPKASSRYALKVTYWKDSILPSSGDKIEPVYPVTYGLAHFMAARGVLSAARTLGETALEAKADHMYRAGIEAFMGPEHFTIYRDSDSELKQDSSDELHSLAYIPTSYRNILPLSAIRRRSKSITSLYGYMCTPPVIAQSLPDKYHGDKVWVFEQAFIHYGSTKFDLSEQAVVAEKIAPYIAEGQELFGIDNGKLTPEGNNHQLWSVAASNYFANKSFLHDNRWL